MRTGDRTLARVKEWFKRLERGDSSPIASHEGQFAHKTHRGQSGNKLPQSKLAARGRSLAAAISPGHNRSVKAPPDSRAGRSPSHPDSAEVKPCVIHRVSLPRISETGLAGGGLSSWLPLALRALSPCQAFYERRIPTANSTSRSLPPAAGAPATPAESVPKTSSPCATSTSRGSSRRRKSTPRPSASRTSARYSTGRTTSTPWW